MPSLIVLEAYSKFHLKNRIFSQQYPLLHQKMTNFKPKIRNYSAKMAIFHFRWVVFECKKRKFWKNVCFGEIFEKIFNLKYGLIQN